MSSPSDTSRGGVSKREISLVKNALILYISLTKNFRELLFCLKLMRENTWQTIENNFSAANQYWFSFFAFSQRLGGFLK